MRILIACEESQIVTEAFLKRGHEVLSCDLWYTGDKGLPHYHGDVREVLNDGWDMMIGFPPCTYLAKAQMYRYKEAYYQELRDQAFSFFKGLMECDIPKICLENPSGYLNTNYCKPEQIISPHFFGSVFKKETCLWLKNLEPLRYPFMENKYYVKPKRVREKGSGYYQNLKDIEEMTKELRTEVRRTEVPGTKDKKYRSVSSRVNSRMDKHERNRIKSRWFPEIAEAMAEQWG